MENSHVFNLTELHRDAAVVKRTRQREEKVPGMPGIYLAVYPSGRKTWIRRYRDPITGKKKTITLGVVA